MPRLSTLLAMLAVIAGAFVLYGIKYDTARIEAELRVSERRLEDLKRDIAVLRAERAHFSRPERIAALARAQGLAPATESRIARSLPPGPVAEPPAAAARTHRAAR